MLMSLYLELPRMAYETICEQHSMLASTNAIEIVELFELFPGPLAASTLRLPALMVST